MIQALCEADVRSYSGEEAAVDLLELALGEALGDTKSRSSSRAEFGRLRQRVGLLSSEFRSVRNGIIDR